MPYGKRFRSRGSLGLSLAAWLFSLLAVSAANAQALGPTFENRPIEVVRLALSGAVPSGPQRVAFEDRVRRALNVYPGSQLHDLMVDFGLGKVKRIPGVASASVNYVDGNTGGVAVEVSVVVGDRPQADPGRVDFPYLLQGDDSLLKLKLTAATLGYANHDAWYGRPQAFVGANRLAKGPAGAGWSSFGEAALEGGLQGIGPIGNNVYAYGSLSYLASGSVGTDLFVTGPRRHGAIEDAYAGIVTGITGDDGSRLVINLSGGRQPFQIADGMLIRITAANGFDRAALQLNPRWAADSLFLAQARYNTTKFEAFRLAPDELAAIDTHTVIAGANLETGLGTPHQLGLTYLTVPRSDYGWYTTTAQGTRQGLQVADVRYYWTPAIGASGPYAKTELALQWNDRNAFPMRAWGGYVEAGYTFNEALWRPTLSYRLSGFSGDNPATRTYERWDPLLSGGTGEEWVQGLNHYKLFQDTNLIAHRLQAILRPAPQWELVPQAWLFQAQQLNNIGGTTSTLAEHLLGYEVNLTVKYFMSRNVMFQSGLALTVPLSGVSRAVAGTTRPWFSAMSLARISF